ncbi:hypothetical protein U1Q18_045351 [Sarracenia purpurea var. burkii]
MVKVEHPNRGEVGCSYRRDRKRKGRDESEREWVLQWVWPNGGQYMASGGGQSASADGDGRWCARGARAAPARALGCGCGGIGSHGWWLLMGVCKAEGRCHRREGEQR